MNLDVVAELGRIKFRIWQLELLKKGLSKVGKNGESGDGDGLPVPDRRESSVACVRWNAFRGHWGMHYPRLRHRRRTPVSQSVHPRQNGGQCGPMCFSRHGWHWSARLHAGLNPNPTLHLIFFSLSCEVTHSVHFFSTSSEQTNPLRFCGNFGHSLAMSRTSLYLTNTRTWGMDYKHVCGHSKALQVAQWVHFKCENLLHTCITFFLRFACVAVQSLWNTTHYEEIKNSFPWTDFGHSSAMVRAFNLLYLCQKVTVHS